MSCRKNVATEEVKSSILNVNGFQELQRDAREMKKGRGDNYGTRDYFTRDEKRSEYEKSSMFINVRGGKMHFAFKLN